MKLRKIFALLLAATMMFVLIAACATDTADPTPPATDAGNGETAAPPVAPPAGNGEITIVNNKVEIHGALSEFGRLYYELTGVYVDVQSFGGETPYAPALSAMFAAGTEPEIFVFEGIAGYNDARGAGRVFDLSGQPWLADTDLAYISPTDGTPVGFPVNIEGWGLAYNRRILAEVGIDTSTLTNVNAIRAALEAVYAQKDALGLDAVVTITAGAGMEWVTGLHGVNAYLSLGLDYEDTSIIDMLLAGEVDTDRLTAFAEYYHMLFQFADQAILTTGGYDASIAQFALENSAFLHQGNWVDPVFADLGVHFEMGYIPHAFFAHDTPGIFVGAPSWYMVNARADNIEAALDFLNFMASSPEGHHYMAIASGQVPAFRSVALQPEGPLSVAVMEWSGRGQIYAWHQNEMPDGFGMGTLGPIFALLADGTIGVTEFVDMFTAAVSELG
ncbi:MAG: ABC transporter substrate-binding protein [Oscillospiraceae bacterium]|nr:ABC transporter substrate-binding protein [Oscillospiraceae bacterium]MCL2279427.1 ABC transporter substrate-binding protein [Oscillospiraceae bacterium]